MIQQNENDLRLMENKINHQNTELEKEKAINTEFAFKVIVLSA